jgi:streptogramin lyase
MKYSLALALTFASVILLFGCEADNIYGGGIYTPAGNIVWVVNYTNSGTVQALNDNGDQYYALTGFTRPRAIDCFANDGSVWILDYYGNNVSKYNISGNQVYQTPTGSGGLLRRPTGLDIYQQNGAVWIANRDDNQIIKLDSDGTLLAAITGFSFPRSVSVVPDTGDCWVANETGGTAILLRESANGNAGYTNFLKAESDDLGTPWDVAAVPGGSVWVCDKNSGTLYGIGVNGNTFAEFTGFDEITSVYIHPTTNAIFAVDKAAGKVIRFPSTTSGTGDYTDFDDFDISGLDGPNNIWIDDTSGKIFVTEMGADSVGIYSSSGVLLSTFTGFTDPIDIAYWVQ